ncbi:quinone oxidoreductase family protein [Enterococcus faecalis]
MKAFIAQSYDGPEKMNYVDVKNPIVKDDDVLIKVKYSGVGLVDILFSRGFGNLSLPLIPGLEVSGIIEKVGKNVTRFKVGDKVAALTINSLKGFSEFVSIHEDYVVEVPDHLDSGIAAGSLTNTATALVLLKEITPVSIGKSVLVYGATGGLGSQVGQVAKLLGADRVVGVVGNKEKQIKAYELGYDEVFLKDSFFSNSKDTFDIIVDPIGGKQRKTNLDRLNPYGSLVIVGNASQEQHANINPDDLWLRNTTLTGFNFGMYTAHHTKKVNHYLNWTIRLMENNQIQLPTLYKESIKNAKQALLDLENGKINGKLLLKHP